MKFKLLGDWPVHGAFVVPAGTVIDGEAPTWNGMRLPLPLPLNAQALDQEAYDAACLAYPNHLHQLHYAAGIKPRTEAQMPGWRASLTTKGTDNERR